MSAFSELFSARQIMIIAAVFLVFAGCGEEDGIGQGTSGDLELIPRSVNFSPVIIGETATETLQIRNAGEETSITIRDIELVENPDEQGSHEVFELVDASEGEVDIAPGESTELEIRYAPEASEPYNALLTFGTNLPNRTEVEVDVEAPAPEPELLADDVVSFDRVPAGSEQWILTEVDNIGYADLVIREITLSGPEEFDISFPVGFDELDEEELTDDQQEALDALQDEYEGDLEDELETAPPIFDRDEPRETVVPGESLPIRLYYAAEDDDFRTAQLDIATNDPNAQPSHLVAVTANSDAPCLELIEDEVDFELASIGNTSHKTINLRNCSSIAQTVVNDISIGAMNGDEFDPEADIKFDIQEDSLPESLQNGNVLALEPEQSFSIVVTYAPTDTVEDTATLYASSNDEASPLLADVKGEGADLECPIAEAEAAIAGSDIWNDEMVFGIPLDVIEFDGAESYDPDGTEVSYEWSVAQRPNNSTAQIANPQSENPTLTADIAGHFVVELMVYDGAGIGACEPATIDITIEPESAIHVELTWEVPASDDGTGTDLDLHYLHPNGSWNQQPWDVYYQNTEPDWQDGSDVSLDIDDLTGEEPENINHDNPDSAYDYSTGVYYFGDSLNYGGSDARVRIYLNGDLFFERERRLHTAGGTELPGAGDFWYVGDIEVEQAGALILNEIDEVYEDAGFPSD